MLVLIASAIFANTTLAHAAEALVTEDITRCVSWMADGETRHGVMRYPVITAGAPAAVMARINAAMQAASTIEGTPCTDELAAEAETSEDGQSGETQLTLLAGRWLLVTTTHWDGYALQPDESARTQAYRLVDGALEADLLALFAPAGRTWLVDKLTAYHLAMRDNPADAESAPCRFFASDTLGTDIVARSDGEVLELAFSGGAYGARRCYDEAPLQLPKEELERYLAPTNGAR